MIPPHVKACYTYNKVLGNSANIFRTNGIYNQTADKDYTIIESTLDF